MLYNDDTNGLQIISAGNVDNVPLGGGVWTTGRDSYNSAIVTLNEAAYDYAENSPYALDGRCVGSVPTVGADGTFTAKNTEEIGPVTLQFTTTVEGANSMKDVDTNYSTDQTAMQAIGGDMWTTGERYWLASRDVGSYSSYCYFFVRNVNTSGDLHNCNLCYAPWAGNALGYSNERGLRPCISLDQNVKVVGGGDGSSEEQAYELGI